MTAVDVLDASGETAGSVDLPSDLFDAQANIALMHQVVVGQLAAARQGTHDTKNRGEVSGGGRKPYRQKGTGRARQGSTRAPQFAGGGVVHGPTPHGYAQRTPKKMKAAALRGALSDRAREGRVHVVETFSDGSPSTKTAVALLAKITERPRPLVVLDRTEESSWLSLRNVPAVHLLWSDQLNTYDVLASDDVVFTRTAFDAFVAARGTAEVVNIVEAEPAGDEKTPATKPAKKSTAKKSTAKKSTAKKATKAAKADESAADESADDESTDSTEGAEEAK